MGTVFTAGNFIGAPSLSPEAQDSLDQILYALNQEFKFRPLNHHHHHQEHLPITHSLSTTADEFQNHSPQTHRTKSLDRQGSEERKITRRTTLSIKKRQWECQLCYTKNETDSQICSDCGSNKINVYIPPMNNINLKQNKTEDQNKLSSSQVISSTTNRRQSSSSNSNIKSNEGGIHRRSVLIAHKRQADEQIVLKHVEKLLRACYIAHSRYKDETFPASSQSLFINGKYLSKSTLKILPEQQQYELSPTKDVQWLRPDQIVPKEWNDNDRTPWTIFRDPKPNDVLQGALGDCWFITALSVLAEEPEYLLRVLITKQYNVEGIYCVRLCKDGEWTQVLVDDRLPCTSSRKLAYSQAHRKQLWVPLIEKALAKLNGSYEAIIAGRCCEGLATVTGSPCETLILGRSNNPDDKNVDYNRLWSKLLYAHSQRFLMCAMCSNNLISKDEFEKYGLLNIHAYSLQDVKQSKDGRHRLLKLRNPWGGTYRWTGDWSDNSRLWSENPDLRYELLDIERNKRDGVFWMPFKSFVRYFECVDICKLRHNWYEVRDSANFYPSSKKMQAYYLKLSNPTELDIMLHRKISKNLRIHRSDVSLCIGVINMEEHSNGTYRIYSMPIVSARGQHKFISTNGSLQPGLYVILPFLFNPTNKYLDNTEFTIAIHSSHVIDLERVKLPVRIEREFLIKLCLFYGEPVRVVNKSDKDNHQSDGVTIYELKNYWDGLVLLVENRNQTKFVHFHFHCSISQNAVISRKNSQQELYDVIPPNYRQIIVSIARESPSQSFTIGHDFQYVLSTHNYIKVGEGVKLQHWPELDDSDFSDDIHVPQYISSTKQN